MSFGILIDSKNVIKLFNDIAPLINYEMLSRLADRNHSKDGKIVLRFMLAAL